MTPAVAYLRCSGESQIQGDTWERQQSKINEYTGAHDITIVSEFRDAAVTGKMELENRSGLSACLTYVREHEIKLVLVEDQTRLARDLIVAEICVREFQKLGVQVIAASGGVNLTEGDDSNPTAKLIRQILAAVSEFERCCIVLKLRGARQRKKAKSGHCEGSYPYGHDPKRPEELGGLNYIMSRVKLGLRPDAIASEMNEDGLFLTRGVMRNGILIRGSWRASLVRKIIRREVKP